MGKEGPMIHSGAVVGAGLPQVRVDGLMGWEGASPSVVSQAEACPRVMSAIQLGEVCWERPNMASESDVS